MFKMAKPMKVYNADGTPNKKGSVTKYIETTLFVGPNNQWTWMYVANLGHEDLILGMPWLWATNPIIDWKKGTLKLKPWKFWIQKQTRGKPIVKDEPEPMQVWEVLPDDLPFVIEEIGCPPEDAASPFIHIWQQRNEKEEQTPMLQFLATENGYVDEIPKTFQTKEDLELIIWYMSTGFEMAPPVISDQPKAEQKGLVRQIGQFGQGKGRWIIWNARLNL